MAGMSHLCLGDPRDDQGGSPRKPEALAKTAFGPHLWEASVPPCCRSRKAHARTCPMQRQVLSVTHGRGSGRPHTRVPWPEGCAITLSAVIHCVQAAPEPLPHPYPLVVCRAVVELGDGHLAAISPTEAEPLRDLLKTLAIVV